MASTGDDDVDGESLRLSTCFLTVSIQAQQSRYDFSLMKGTKKCSIVLFMISRKNLDGNKVAQKRSLSKKIR